MKVVVTFDINEKNLDDLVVMAKVYRKKDGYKEFVSVENNLPLKPLPQKMTMEKALKMERVGAIKDIYTTWNACLDEITGE